MGGLFKAKIYYPSDNNNLTTLSPPTSFFSHALIKNDFILSSQADDVDGGLHKLCNFVVVEKKI